MDGEVGKRVRVRYYSVGQWAHGRTYYAVPERIAAVVMPSGYYGWDDCATTTWEVSGRVLGGRRAVGVRSVAEARQVLRGERAAEVEA